MLALRHSLAHRHLQMHLKIQLCSNSGSSCSHTSMAWPHTTCWVQCCMVICTVARPQCMQFFCTPPAPRTLFFSHIPFVILALLPYPTQHIGAAVRFTVGMDFKCMMSRWWPPKIVCMQSWGDHPRGVLAFLAMMIFISLYHTFVYPCMCSE